MRFNKNSKGFTALRSEAEHVKMRWWAQPLAEKPQGVERKRDGFTLIELLVVIAIIGLLASIVIVSVGTARAKARDAKRLADMKSFQTAIELYKEAFSGNAPAAPAALAPTYIGRIPNDPKTNNPYTYTNTSGDDTYFFRFVTETKTDVGDPGTYCATTNTIEAMPLGGVCTER